jgi:hypothetical protein
LALFNLKSAPWKAPWKVATAVKMKATTDVTNSWLAEQLDMGSGIYVSKHVGLWRKKNAENI